MRLLLVISLLFSLSVNAEPLSQAQYERTQSLYLKLRCMVCDGQSLAASDAPLANDMKELIKQRIISGDSDEAIINDLVNSYGETILMQPPVTQATMLLWIMPVLLLIGGLFLMFRITFNRAG